MVVKNLRVLVFHYIVLFSVLLLKLWVEFYVLVKNENPHTKQLSNTHRDEDLNCILITLPRGLIPVALLLYGSFMDANN